MGMWRMVWKLGDYNINRYSSPVQVPGTTWSMLWDLYTLQ